tara:strand:- start:1069 stop:2691 length:1623 start_codon:yes stop_codon:yes gene_type:complete
MAQVINMPRLSDTMEEGVVAKWLVNIGDKVSEGDILAEIETDKATMEFESFHDGVLLYIGINEGETAAVDTLLAIIGEKNEDISSILNPEIKKDSTQLDLVDQINETEKNNDDSHLETIEDSKDSSKNFEIIKMPRLSDTMEEGTVSTWLVKVGEKVNEGDILAEIETDKATMEFESFYEGTLLYIGINEGETATVDSLLAIIGDENADFSSALSNIETDTKTEEKPTDIEDVTDPETFNSDVTIDNSLDSIERIFISPLAKKIALEKNIDLNLIKGSGENGRIVKSDIDNFVPKVKETKDLKVISQPTSLKSSESFDEIENSQMRKVIARRLTESKFSAPHYYLSVEFDMNNTIAFRKQYNTLPDTKISYNDIVVKACAISLKKHPKVNSQWFPEKIRINHHVHIGVAVGVSDGLLVPVIKHANDKSLTQIGSEIKDMAVRSRDKKIKPEEMEGSTFTISNLGMYGIHEFTSIINQPNSAILSVGSIIKKPVVKDEKILVGNTMKLTLACDHRTVDGVTGSEFLETLRGYIENPVTMLV